MANPKPEKDANTDAEKAVRKVTGAKPQKGEDLIRDPKLKAAFIELKKLAAKKG
jgi:hypothetical protein